MGFRFRTTVSNIWYPVGTGLSHTKILAWVPTFEHKIKPLIPGQFGKCFIHSLCIHVSCCLYDARTEVGFSSQFFTSPVLARKHSKWTDCKTPRVSFHCVMAQLQTVACRELLVYGHHLWWARTYDVEWRAFCEKIAFQLALLGLLGGKRSPCLLRDWHLQGRKLSLEDGE